MSYLNDIKTELLKLEPHVFIQNINDKYDNTCSIFVYDGKTDTFFDDNTIRHHYVQIRIRDTDFINGNTRAEAIFQVFKKYNIEGLKILCKKDVIPIGNDEKNRSNFTINMIVTEI